MGRKYKPDPLIIALIAFEILLVFLYIGNWTVGRPYTKLNHLTDLDGEASICCWFSVVQLSLVAMITSVIAFARFDRNKLISWTIIGIPVIFFLLSMDEHIQIHEWLGVRSDVFLKGGSRLNTPYRKTGIWAFLIGIPFMAFFLTYIYLLKKYVGSIFNFRIFTFGTLVFLGGAMTHDMFNNIYPDTNTLSGIIIISLEEFLEMFGITIILAGMLDTLKSILQYQRNEIKSVPPQKSEHLLRDDLKK